MTQHQLITEYIKEHGSILPAKCYGLVYKDQMLGSETSKRCRELRAKGVLRSEQDGKFERFYLIELNAEYGNYENIPKPFSQTVKNMEQQLTDKVAHWNSQFYPPKKEDKQTTPTLF